ncbi:MAG: ImmA/IrrE family metallo-endopeptidase [Lactobacillus sp.]|nr:MAG: ImmA/IrrE family metallo-endopeptidase [Lactobacillus sp.]
MKKEDIIRTTKLIVDRYQTANPFLLAEKLNVEVDWMPLGNFPLGKTIYDNSAPLIVLNERIKNKPIQYFTLSHELGHVILQEGLVGYYVGVRFGHAKLENEANEFAVSLLGQLYIEENYRIPNNYFELVGSYGLPADNIIY